MKKSEEVLLRRALNTMAESLGDQEAEPSTPRRHSGQKDRRRMTMLIGAAAALVMVVALPFILQKNDNDEVAGQEASQGLTLVQEIACSTGIGIGTVTQVEPGREPEERELTVTVNQWLKPSTDRATTVSFYALPYSQRVGSAFQPGQQLIFTLWGRVDGQDRPERAAWVLRRDVRGEHDFYLRSKREVTANLDVAERTTCPDFWHHPSPVPGDS